MAEDWEVVGLGVATEEEVWAEEGTAGEGMAVAWEEVAREVARWVVVRVAAATGVVVWTT